MTIRDVQKFWFLIWSKYVWCVILYLHSTSLVSKSPEMWKKTLIKRQFTRPTPARFFIPHKWRASPDWQRPIWCQRAMGTYSMLLIDEHCVMSPRGQSPKICQAYKKKVTKFWRPSPGPGLFSQRSAEADVKVCKQVRDIGSKNIYWICKYPPRKLAVLWKLRYKRYSETT